MCSESKKHITNNYMWIQLLSPCMIMRSSITQPSLTVYCISEGGTAAYLASFQKLTFFNFRVCAEGFPNASVDCIVVVESCLSGLMHDVEACAMPSNMIWWNTIYWLCSVWTKTEYWRCSLSWMRTSTRRHEQNAGSYISCLTSWIQFDTLFDTSETRVGSVLWVFTTYAHRICSNP